MGIFGNRAKDTYAFVTRLSCGGEWARGGTGVRLRGLACYGNSLYPINTGRPRQKTFTLGMIMFLCRTFSPFVGGPMNPTRSGGLNAMLP